MSNPQTGACEHGYLGCGVRWECNGCNIDRLEARAAELEAALKRIAFMGGDCPAEMPEAAFYRGQLYDAITTASAALNND